MRKSSSRTPSRRSCVHDVWQRSNPRPPLRLSRQHLLPSLNAARPGCNPSRLMHPAGTARPAEQRNITLRPPRRVTITLLRDVCARTRAATRPFHKGKKTTPRVSRGVVLLFYYVLLTLGRRALSTPPTTARRKSQHPTRPHRRRRSHPHRRCPAPSPRRTHRHRTRQPRHRGYNHRWS